MQRSSSPSWVAAVMAILVATAARAASPDWTAVEPLLGAACYGCHAGADAKGGVDLRGRAAAPEIAGRFDFWQGVVDVIEGGDMPPPNAKPLAAESRAAILAYFGREFAALAAANAGDPGPVTLRRLTNAEYDRSIRDLTGRDFAPAREFQPDGGGGEGFSNNGDVLFVSPAALDKYFSAARHLADHATIMPGTGIVFHDHRIGLRGPEQLKAQAEQTLYVWYQQKASPHLPGDFADLREADYLLACWKHRHFATPLDTLAAHAGLEPAFLHNWWRLVTGTEPASRFLDLVRVPWRQLPGLDPGMPDKVPAVVRREAARIQAELRSWNNPQKPGSGVQRSQQDADGIRPYPVTADVKGHDRVHLCFGDLGDGNAGDVALVTAIDLKLAKRTVRYLDWLTARSDELAGKIAAGPPAEEATALAEAIARLRAAHALFGRHPHADRTVEPGVLAVEAPRVVTLPLPDDAVSLRAETRLDFGNPAVDKATIQWLATTGAPPDVTAIIPGVLTIWKIQTEAAKRTMGEFHALRVAFPDMFERRLEEVTRNLYRDAPGYTVYSLSDAQLGDVLGPADANELAALKKDWRFVSPRELNKQQAAECDRALVGHLHAFAERAWRRTLSADERDALAALYAQGCASGLDRESAMRESIVRALVSPHFLYKPETLPAAAGTVPTGTVPTGTVPTNAAPAGDLPLSSWQLASRLSYFLWSSLPDERLRAVAAGGGLDKPGVLADEARRMLADARVSALAEVFAGEWLSFATFDAHDGVDTTRYPEMTADLRADMKREAVEFMLHVFREDRPVMDVVTGTTTFLNERLARFYGVSGVVGPEFREVDVSAQHRGGILGMGAILTKTSRPDRTSPVLRGEFLSAVILGQPSPPPPPNVPELQQGLEPASLREALAIHRQDAACAVCHDRIDPLGFALESFDPVGRHRTTDEHGGAIDDTGHLRDGTRLEGLAGLRRHLGHGDLFVRQFCRKLLGYALGRAVLPTDRDLLERMVAAIRAHDGRVSAAVVEIVQSRQFRQRRGEAVAVTATP
jgi:hypothetical protein